MKEVSKSENIIACLICREADAEFLMGCNHNFHMNVCNNGMRELKTNSILSKHHNLERKIQSFFENIQNIDSEIDTVFGEEYFEEIVSFLKFSKVFQYLIRNVKGESAKGRFLQLEPEKGNFDVVRTFQ